MDSRCVLTIATGKKLYVDMAVNLARSFFTWHPDDGIRFRIVTDNPELIPADVRAKAEIATVLHGELGEGFSSKLHLDKLAVEGQTLFIDSDCLIFGRLDRVFEKFKGHSVSVVGGYIATGEWFGDIGAVCKRFNVPHLPKFNGGIYYIEKDDIATKVYQTARDLEPLYDQIGFVRLRGRPNDEVLMALAMQLNGQTPVTDDGTIMSDPQACPGVYTIDVLNGKCLLQNPPPPSALHQAWYPFQKVSPLVVHFLGYFTQHYPYRREAYRLSKASGRQINTFNKLKALIMIEYPERLKIFSKQVFRPLYRALFGTRKVKTSDRVVA